MKKILPVLLMLACFGTQAQKIMLTKGQQITITSTSTQDIDMAGMGMQIKNNTSTSSIVEITESSKDNFMASYKLSKFNFTMDMMGQQTVYDSEKPSDEDSEMGKAMAGKIGKPVPVTINKNDGSVSMESSGKDTAMLNDSSNPLDGIMQSFGAVGEDATVSTAFFIVPKEKKAGDSWVDSNLINKMKEIKTYTIKSVAAGITTIGMFSILEGTSSVETQGMQMDITLSGKTEGEILVDVKSSLVKKRSSVMDLTGSIDMMGQSIPMTSKAIVNISYN